MFSFVLFSEFGVFVDQRGQRTRALDVKWSGLPLAFGKKLSISIHFTFIYTIKNVVKEGLHTVMAFKHSPYTI